MTLIFLRRLFATNGSVPKHPNVLLTEDLIQKIYFFIFEAILFVGETIVVIGELSRKVDKFASGRRPVWGGELEGQII